MKRFIGSALAIVSLALSAQGVSAQATVFVSGGASIPVSDYADYAKIGYMAQAGISFPVGTAGLLAGVGGLYGSNNHDTDGDKTNLMGAAAFLQYEIGTTAYLFAGPGYVKHSYKSDTFPEGSASGLAAAGGGGINIPLGGLNGYVEGMYLTGFGDIDGTDAFVASFGATFPLGG
ncbi:MAG: hypothetical protein ABL963_13895 [Longimicrobiales bacterium]